MIDEAKILFYSDPVDMRKSIDTLCVLITETLQQNPTMIRCIYFAIGTVIN
jgi:hypothetical protein